MSSNIKVTSAAEETSLVPLDNSPCSDKDQGDYKLIVFSDSKLPTIMQLGSRITSDVLETIMGYLGNEDFEGEIIVMRGTILEIAADPWRVKDVNGTVHQIEKVCGSQWSSVVSVGRPQEILVQNEIEIEDGGL